MLPSCSSVSMLILPISAPPCVGGFSIHIDGGKPATDKEVSATKVTVDVDCTPEEARRFLGLPDLTPVHEAYVEKMRKAMSEGVTPEAVGELMKSWGPMS